MGLEDLPLFRIETDQKAVWVSALELAKATFGLSSAWLRLMAEGGIHDHPDLHRRIIDPERSLREADDPTKLHLAAYRQLNVHDLEVAARLCSESTLADSFEGVANHLKRQRFGRTPAHVFMPFPFARPSTWLVEDCWVHSRTSPERVTARRLVTRIADISYDLGISHIKVHHLGGIKAHPPDGTIVSPDQKLTISVKPELDDMINIVTDLPSLDSLGVLRAEVLGEQTITDWTVEHVPVEIDWGQSLKTVMSTVESGVGMATTANKGTKSERAGRIAIRIDAENKVANEADVPRPPGKRLESTLGALEMLSVHLRRELVAVRPVSGPGADPIDGLWRYPSLDSGRVLRWAFTRDGRPRRALVAGIASARGWIYAIEAEHIEVASTQTTTTAMGDDEILGQDGYSALCLLRFHSREFLAPEIIVELLRVQASCRGVWRSDQLKQQIVRVVRSKQWREDNMAYSRGIISGVQKLESRN